MDGNFDKLVSYEDEVLELLVGHGARGVSRVRKVEPGDGPDEVHVIEFPTQDAYAAYMGDPRRVLLAGRRDARIARTEVQQVSIII